MPAVFSQPTDQIVELKNPLLVPWTDATRTERSAMVFDASGGLCVEAVSWKKAGEARSALPNTLPLPEKHLVGRYLFGGILQPHFGHTLAESTGRLWALDKVGDIDGILFFAPNLKAARPRLIEQAKAVLEIFTTGRRVEIVTEPATVDQLVVPEQGFGLKDMAAGTREFSAFVDRTVRWPSRPRRKIYISRTHFQKNGRFLFEERVEQYLASEGYLIFHPQEHSMSEQIKTYRTASHVVGSDCSAMFLAGFAVPRCCRVGIINRRLVGGNLQSRATVRKYGRVRGVCVPSYRGSMVSGWRRRKAAQGFVVAGYVGFVREFYVPQVSYQAQTGHSQAKPRQMKRSNFGR